MHVSHMDECKWYWQYVNVYVKMSVNFYRATQRNHVSSAKIWSVLEGITQFYLSPKHIHEEQGQTGRATNINLHSLSSACHRTIYNNCFSFYLPRMDGSPSRACLLRWIEHRTYNTRANMRRSGLGGVNKPPPFLLIAFLLHHLEPWFAWLCLYIYCQQNKFLNMITWP